MNWILIITNIVTAVAVLIYTVFAGLQWRAIKKQGEYASEQVVKMQGQLIAMQGQSEAMHKGLEETRKIVAQNVATRQAILISHCLLATLELAELPPIGASRDASLAEET